MTITYSESDDCLVSNNNIDFELLKNQIINSKTNVLTNTKGFGDDLTKQRFDSKDILLLINENTDGLELLETNETFGVYIEPEYITSIKAVISTCGFTDTLNTPLIIIFVAILLFFLVKAIYFVITCFKYKKIKDEYEKLKGENDESQRVDKQI